MIFDTHAHYDDEAFDEDRDQLLSSMKDGGVGCIVNVCASAGGFDGTLKLMEAYPFVYGAVGVHPDDAEIMTQDTLDEIRRLSHMEKMVAIGEIGLDYYWHKEEAEHKQQQEMFRAQMDIAREEKLPFMIHSRDAAEDTLEIVKEYIALQQMRYDFIIEINIEDGSYLDQPTVRMLFQPLVENAIRYGLGDDEKISIQVFEDVARHFAVVTISDSGKGMNQEEIDEINQPFDYDWEYWKNENRGIGLRYVKAMLESFYDGQTSLFVNSKKGFGTKITILLPVREPEEKKEKDKEVTLEENKVGQTDERIDCR